MIRNYGPRRRRLGALLGASALAMSLPAMALAQTADDAAGASDREGPLEEVVVTATRRGGQTLQSTAAALSVVTGEQLERAGASQIDEFFRRIPSLSVSDIGPSSKKYVLRGLNAQVLPGATPQVQQYLDDIPLSIGAVQPDLRMHDLEQIEVLRGPQGTLYGVAAMAGVVKLISKKPDLDSFGGFGEVMLSQTQKASDINSSVVVGLNAPLLEGKAAIRLVAYDERDAGFIDNVRLGLSDVNAQRARGYRLSGLVKPTDDLSVRLTYIVQAARSDDTNQVVFDAPAVAPKPPPPGLPPGFPGSPGRPATEGKLESRFATRQPQKEDLSIVNLAVENDFGPVTLYYSGSFADRDRFDAIDLPLQDGQSQIPRSRYAVWSHELRVSTDVESPITGAAGLFYLHRRSSATSDYRIKPPLGEDIYNNLTDLAAFGDLTYKVTDALSLSAGLRYVQTYRTLQVNPEGPPGAPRPPSRFNKFFEENTALKFNASYQLTPDALLYVTVASGFREGGFNQQIDKSFLKQIGLNDEQIANIPLAYDSDKLWNYEAGWRTSWFDDRLNVNGAIFRMDYTDILSPAYIPGTQAAYIDNLGEARIEGVELDFTAYPAPGLTIFGSLSKLHARITDPPENTNAPPIFPPPVKGDRLPGAPEFSALIGADYLHRLDSDLSVFVGGEWSYTGATTTQLAAANVNFRKTPDYALLNLRVGVTLDRYTATLFVDNVSDKRATLTLNNLGGDETVAVNRPRTMGVRLRADF